MQLNQDLNRSRNRLALVYNASGSGGTAYEHQLHLCLQNFWHTDAHPIQNPAGWPRWVRTSTALIDLYRLVRQTSLGYQLVIDTLDAALLRGRISAETWVIVHHLDFSANRHARIYAQLEAYILRCLRKAAKVVTVSNFWKRHLEERGIAGVELIYNPFPVEEFSFSDDEVEAFKLRFGLGGKPILYLGNHAEGKGVEQAYRALCGIDAHFVATGKEVVRVDGLRTEFFEARDYQLLLKASTLAVTMSTFDEGWCRSTHEAMLCETPVVGSGRGGMGELLKGGEQMVCETFEALAPQVSSLLADPLRRRAIGRRGFAFAKQFTVERFTSAWHQLIEGFLQQPWRSTA